MILKFVFEYCSTSLVYEKILLRTLKDSSLNGVLQKDNLSLFMFVEADEDRLEEFAKVLSKELPHSLFLKSSKVEVVEKMPQVDFKLPNYPRRDLPFCPKCFREALQSSDPFTKCEVCGYGVQKSELIYKNFAKEIRGNNEEIFINLANAVKNGAIVKVKTFNGYKKIAKATKESYDNFKDGFELLFCDTFSANETIPLRKGEVLALGSFEKPCINLPISKKLLEMYPFFEDVDRVEARMSDDLMLELMMQYLRKIDIDMVMMGDIKEDENFHIALDFEGDVKRADDLKVIVLNDGTALLSEGDKTLLPKANDNFSSLPIKAFSKKYVSINTDNYIITYDKTKNLPEVLNTFYLKDESKEDNTYEASHGAFYSVIAENALFDKVVSGVYLSKEYNDKLMIYSKRFGLVDYLEFGYKFVDNSKELLDLMSKSGKNAKKLVENYRNKFEDADDKRFEFEKMGDIYKLWGVLSIVLGFYEGADVKNGAKVLCENANSFKGKKGPRIDYKLIREGDKARLDSLRVIKTAMSFKLAGIDAPTLCFGVVESFAEFVSNLMDEISQDYEIDGVCMNGSLFSLEKLVDKFYTITTKNYTVWTNKEFTLDETNLSYGIISGLTKEV